MKKKTITKNCTVMLKILVGVIVQLIKAIGISLYFLLKILGKFIFWLGGKDSKGAANVSSIKRRFEGKSLIKKIDNNCFCLINGKTKTVLLSNYCFDGKINCLTEDGEWFCFVTFPDDFKLVNGIPCFEGQVKFETSKLVPSFAYGKSSLGQLDLIFTII